MSVSSQLVYFYVFVVIYDNPDGKQTTICADNDTILGESANNPPTLDDYPDFTNSQIISCESV